MNLISKEINDKAIQIANNSLQKGFDWQAFLVLSVAQQNLTFLNDERNKDVIDYVKDSGVDENIQLFLNKFINFSEIKKQDNVDNEQVINELNTLLSFLKKIITELYFSSNTMEEREVIKNFLFNIKLG